MKKGDTSSLHQLIFWFAIKNIIPWGQGRNLADAMEQCFIDLIDREEQINLPAIVICHIARIANTARKHDLGYGFLLARVFESLGVKLQKKVGVQAIDDIASSTLMGCGYTLGEGPSIEQGVRTPFPPVSSSSSAQASVETVLHDHAKLKSELSDVKDAMAKEKALNTKQHKDLLALLSALSAKLTPLDNAP